jgi:hypothetical protein
MLMKLRDFIVMIELLTSSYAEHLLNFVLNYARVFGHGLWQAL